MNLLEPRQSRSRGITLRTRLTVVYGAMFFVAGVVLLATTYVLFNQQLSRSEPEFSQAGTPPTADAPPSQSGDGLAEPEIGTDDGEVLSGSDVHGWLQNQEEQLRDSAITSLFVQGGIALLVVGSVSVGFGWLVAGRVLAPLHRVTETARRIAAAPAADRGLHERIALRGPNDEVKELADTFDTMVARLDGSFDGQRRFVANASHELRTPLTLSRGLVELAMHRTQAPREIKQLGESLLAINARHEQLIDGLLLLARSENELTERLPVDLADVIDYVVAQTADEAERAGVTVHTQANEAVAHGETLLLERLTHNLVQNGIRHNTTPDGWVRVVSRTCADANRIELEVSNTGPAVPPHEISVLFEPFRRLDTDRLVTAKGAGLGLSIVRAIARTHGGDVTAQSRVEGGLVMTVRLPMHTAAQ